MRKLLSNNNFTVSVSIVFFLLGFLLSWHYRDFQWLARLGNLIIAVGIVQIARPSILDEEIRPTVGASDSLGNLNDPDYYRRKREPIPEWVTRDSKSRQAVGIIGPITGLIGTLLAGFADLLNTPFGFH